MKYSVHDYAKALDEAIGDSKADKAVIAKNFLEVVRRNGDAALFEKILVEAARISRSHGESRSGFREVRIESARALGKPQEEMLRKFLKPTDVVEYATDPNLIAGVKIIVNDEMQFDGTMKAKLDKLFAVQTS